MKAFTFVRPTTVEDAAKAAAVNGSVIKAGGIDLLDRMKERVDEPERVVWLGDVPDPEMGSIHVHENVTSPANDKRTMRIGGLVTLAQLAESDDVRKYAPALADAASLAASPQIRQRATLAGNLAQHTRCGYYRHASFPCLKRGDADCPVLRDGAVQDNAAVFGNQLCASASPSSLAPVLAAFGAKAIIQRVGSAEDVTVPLEKLFAAPQRGRRGDLDLAPSDVVTGVMFQASDSERSVYEEVRQKSAFDWALVSCAVSTLSPLAEGNYWRGQIWLGSVAPTPWRATDAEKAFFKGPNPSDSRIAAAAEAAVAGATPLPGSAYKVDLVKVVVRRALERLRSAK